ncbi:MAG TPA: ectonucleotide pyrophosphatase/phosphodiesterase [Gemmatimonas sp.]|nr:ectonucleotide pyrophosphatase/phosphodiesterase [Gemmatimonas sp.]
MISIDGLKPEYVHKADSLGLHIPTLRALAAAGASASGVIGVLPTVTYPSHATLVTGVAPARHGILSNTTFDPLMKNQGGWYWYAEDLRVPTLWDAVRLSGGTSAAVHWPVNVGAGITWNVSQLWRTGMPDDRKLLRAVSTNGLLDSLERRAREPYPDGIDESITGDERRARFVARLIEYKRPTLALAYLTALDHEQHEAGPWTPRAYAVLERVDAALDTIVQAARRVYGNTLTIAVVSDHGFTATHTEVHVGVAFARRGLVTVPGQGDEQPSDWRAMIWPSGGTAAIVLRDTTSRALRDSVQTVLRELAADSANGIAEIVDRPALASAGAYPGATFVVAFRAGFRLGYRLRGELRGAVSGGTHGYMPHNEFMRSTLLISGPGIRRGLDLGVVDMRDIAPTVAARIGVRLPLADGRDLLPETPRTKIGQRNKQQ